MTLRARINAIIYVTGVLIVYLGTIAVIGNARDSVKEEIQASANLAVQLLASGDFALGTPLFTELEKTRHLHIQLIDSNGKTTAISRARVGAQTRIVPDWFIWAVKPESLTIVREIADNHGQKLKVRIDAEPYDEISEAWQESQSFLLLFFGFAVAVLLSVNLILHRAFKAIAVILSGLKDIEKGEYNNRLPDFSTPEFSGISRAINHAAAALQTLQRQNAALALHSLEIQEAERQRLAQELHDELGQSLTAIKTIAVANQQSRPQQNGGDHTIISICDRLFAVIRSMMQRLHPLVLTELGLQASLENLADTWRFCNPEIAIDLHCQNGVDACDKSRSIHIFRIVQECLTNAVKHSGASQVTVMLTTEGKGIRLEVSDNGRGCNLNRAHNGFGLLGMRERVTSLRGRLEIISSPGTGMTVSAAIPGEIL